MQLPGEQTEATGRDEPIRVLIADDHPLLRGGIAAVLAGQDDITVVGEASDGHEAIAGFHRLRPDIVLMDYQMPGMNGLDAIRAITASAPGSRIIVLTTYPRQANIVRSIEAGARGYLVKTSLRNEMIDAIRTVHRGETYVPAEMADIAREDYEALGERERTVLTLMARGRTNKQIGVDLSLSTDTIKVTLKTLYQKMKVFDRTQAVMKAARRGYLDIDD